MMNVQELATLRRYRLPLKIVLHRQFAAGHGPPVAGAVLRREFLGDRPQRQSGLFAEVAHAFGIEAFTIDHREQVSDAIRRLLETDGPILCHVRIDPRENVWPLVPPNSSNVQMMEKGW